MYNTDFDIIILILKTVIWVRREIQNKNKKSKVPKSVLYKYVEIIDCFQISHQFFNRQYQ